MVKKCGSFFKSTVRFGSLSGVNNPGITNDLEYSYFISANYHKKRTLITAFFLLAACLRLMRAEVSQSVCYRFEDLSKSS